MSNSVEFLRSFLPRLDQMAPKIIAVYQCLQVVLLYVF